jgi:nitroreductase
MDVFEAIYTRRAIREFAEGEVERFSVLALIDAAVQAPSAMDLQPWAFFVVQGKAVLERLSSAAKTHLLDSVAPSSPLAKQKDMLADPSFNIFYGASTLIIVCADGSEQGEAGEGAEDCCLAAENLMLAARAKDLGTCWVGFARPWLTTAKAKQELGIPSQWTPVAPIIVGQPRHMPPPPPRRAPKIVWFTKSA